MKRGKSSYQPSILFAVIFLLLIGVTSPDPVKGAELYDGFTFDFPSENVSLEVSGQVNVSDAGVYSDRVNLEGVNLSLSTNKTDNQTFYLWRSKPDTSELFQLSANVSDPVKLNYSFEDLEPPKDKYRFELNGTNVKNYSTGGTIFYLHDANKSKNLTLKGEQDFSTEDNNDDEDDGGGGGGSSGESETEESSTGGGFFFGGGTSDENNETNQTEDNLTVNRTEKNQTSDNQTQEERTYCGDFICQNDESWRTCEIDCEKPSKVTEANTLILEAEDQIEEGEDGYEQLREARQKFQEENYTAAKQLASQALKQNKEQLSVPWLGISGGLTGLILILIAAWYGPGYVRSYLMSWKANREIKKIKDLIKSRKKEGKLENAQRTKQQIDNAERALLEDRHEDAMEILKQIEQDLKYE